MSTERVSMPAPLFSYLRGLLQGLKPTATSLSRQFGYSHDQLTRALRKQYAWKSWYVWLLQMLFGSLSGGCLILDDTVLAKPFGKKFPQACMVWDSSQEKAVFGYNLIFLCWSNDTVTIPLCWRWYKKDSKTKTQLAHSLLREAKYIWRLTPEKILFDSWYASEAIINQITTYHWLFVTRLKKNRILRGCRVDEDLIHDGDELVGLATGQCTIRVIKNDQRFLATNDLNLLPNEIISWYGERWAIEDCFRFLKNQLHIAGCQARSKRAQQIHLLTGITAYLILQKEQEKNPEKSLYALKEDWMFDKRLGLNRLRHYQKLLVAA